MNIFTLFSQKRIIAAVMGVVLCFGVVFSTLPTQRAHAQSEAEIQLQILQLQILLMQLQAQLQALLAAGAEVSGGAVDEFYDISIEVDEALGMGEQVVDAGAQDQAVMDIEFSSNEYGYSVQDILVTFENESGDNMSAPYPWHTFNDVSLWMNGDKVAELDLNSESDWPYYGTEKGNANIVKFENLNLAWEADDEINLVLAVGTDSDAAGEDWLLGIGDVVFERENSGQEFAFGSSAEIAVAIVDEDGAAELTVSVSSDNPDATTIEVEEDDETGPYTVFVMEIEEENGVDVYIEEMTFEVDVDGANVLDVIDEADLYYAGDWQDADIAADGSIRFEDLDFEIYAHDQEDVSLQLSFEEQERYGEGVTVQASFVSIDEVEDENGNDDAEIKVSGSASGEVHTLSIYAGPQDDDDCYSGGFWYEEGTTKTTIVDEAGSTTSIADAYFVCEDGEWEIEGGYPSEPTPDADSCYSAGAWYEEGTKKTTITNEDGSTSSIADAYFVCEDGEWEIEGSYPAEPTGTYKGYMNGNNFITTKNITYSDALDNCELNANNNPNTPVYCTWEGQIIFDNTDNFEEESTQAMPEENAASCYDNGDAAVGDFACYGIWDYGNDFGNDHHMCSSDGSASGSSPYSSQGTGCVIETPSCDSGIAKAIDYDRGSSLSGSKLQTIADRLDTSEANVNDGIVYIWEYQCISDGDVLGASISLDILEQVGTVLAGVKYTLNALEARY